jgi:hypothetical protein
VATTKPRREKKPPRPEPEEPEVKDEYAPRLVRKPRTKEKKERRPAASVVSIQVPEEYEGEVTAYPSYWKAVLYGLLAGVLLAGAYATFEWWRHSGRWIFGWIIGFVVGIVVVLASGRHFSWKLGLISTGIAWFSLMLGQVGFSMLDVRFNKIIPLKLPFFTLLNDALGQLGRSLLSWWLIMFFITGLVAFLVSFRPWPIRLQLSGPPEDAPSA